MLGARSSPARVGFSALTLAVLAATAGMAGRAATVETTQTLTVDSSAVTAVWKEGWLRNGAAVRFTGSVDSTSTLTAVLRRVDRPGVVTARAVFPPVQAGPFTERLVLPPRALPGQYTLRVAGTSGATKLVPVDLTVTIPAPPEGVLDRALVAPAKTGPWQAYGLSSPPVIHGRHKVLWMRFRFLHPPTSQNVKIVWKYKWHILLGKVYRRYESTLDTYVKSKSNEPLVPGRWNVILTIGGRVAKQMDVLLR
jgi:hypothetical protein